MLDLDCDFFTIKSYLIEIVKTLQILVLSQSSFYTSFYLEPLR